MIFQFFCFELKGHETSGSSMAWTLFMIASHPDVQKRIHEELDEVFEGDRNRPVTIPDLGKLKYLDMVMKESLRICPPIPVIFRHIHQDIPLGKLARLFAFSFNKISPCPKLIVSFPFVWLDDGKAIPAGTSIALNILELHRDPTVFPDPMKFDPDRFLPENCLGRSAYAFVPFAAGPRNCIGKIVKNIIFFPLCLTGKLRQVVRSPVGKSE